MTHHRCSPRARSHAQFRPIHAVNATWASRKPFRHQTCRLSLSSPPYKFPPRLGFQVSSFQVPQRELKEKSSEGCDSKRGEMGGPDLQMPPGFRFHPTDEELVTYYLCRKCAGQSIAVPIIAEIDLYKYEPWLLPGMALYGEKEWYFFSPRDRKYPNGSRPNRAAGSGYWKATGADKPITPAGTPKPVAIKKALVFYAGKAPKGEKTNWIMHEYRLADVDRSARRKNSLRLDDWVLCRIYNKKGGAEKPATPKTTASRSIRPPPPAAAPEQKPSASSHVPQQQAYSSHVPQLMDFHYFDTSDSMPRLHADSSCSGHVPSPEFAPEVQSRPRWGEWDRSLEAAAGGAAVGGGGGGGMMQFGGDEGMTSGFRDPLQDIFLHLLKPF